MTQDRKIFSLKQVAASIQKTLAERYASTYWVQAEMYKLNYTFKGHCYPELVQKEDGKLVAEMRGTIWKTHFDRIQKQFHQIAKEPFRDGMNLLFLVKINFHPLYGMGLEIVDIDPTFTLGELQKEREETLKKLAAEGILNANQQLEFPLLPKRIALISVESSKGLSDFYSVIDKVKGKYTFFFHLFTAQLNGDAAVDSITKQLENIRKLQSHFDAVCIVRGGGGEIGLACYNQYALAKAIATFPLPVLTGIGHSTNVTVSEMVSFRNAITPTELADFLIDCFAQFEQSVLYAQETTRSFSSLLLRDLANQLTQEIRFFRQVSERRYEREKNALKQAAKHTKTLLQHRFSKEQNAIEQNNRSLLQLVKNRRWMEDIQLKQMRDRLKKSQLNLLNKHQQHADDVLIYLHKKTPELVREQNQLLQQMQRQVDLLNPLQVLKRGYAIARHNGKTISAADQLLTGNSVEITTFDLHIQATIDHIQQTENE